MGAGSVGGIVFSDLIIISCCKGAAEVASHDAKANKGLVELLLFIKCVMLFALDTLPMCQTSITILDNYLMSTGTGWIFSSKTPMKSPCRRRKCA